MSLSTLFGKKAPAVLHVQVNGVELCTFYVDDLPAEKNPSVRLDTDSSVSFIDASGVAHTHSLGQDRGWAHFSIRLHANRGCQADCVISDSPAFDPDALSQGKAIGIRFQPFFLSEAAVSNTTFSGKGLFSRGMHFSGSVTPGSVMLSCECDHCHCSFLIRSYHAGFSESGYFYSASGKYTITVSHRVPGSPAPLSTPQPEALAELERLLPDAPDGSRYGYLNPFRCPHCGDPYINFADNPGMRENEYYGNYFADAALLRYEPVEA